MKTNVKAKKTVAKKVTPATKSASKKPAKAPIKSPKPAAKTTVAKKPVAKVTAKKAAAPVKKIAAKASKPAKSVKPLSKKDVKVTAKKATPVKAVKAPAKAAAKAPAKVTAKTAAKTTKAAVKAPAIKAAPKAAAAKPASKVTVAKETPKTVAAQPVIVKMADNQNIPVKSPMIAVMRPQPVATQKDATAPAAARPVYRPIQVINKPLAPTQPVRQMAPISKADEKVEFKKGDYVVYPAHGVGEIEAVETQIIGGMEIKLYAIVFEKDRMRLKVPVFKAHASGLRRLSSANRMQDALKTLQGRAQIRRAMWSRRAQEYETKINSGDPVSIAEVLRDLKRSNDDTEQSYSERQIYQSALERLAREVAAVDKISEIEAAERLENMIRGRRARAATQKDDAEEAVA